MHWDIAAASIFVGFVIGLTGMGGGALMTPMLVILFNIAPSAAISSDVVASFILKPIGGGVHIRKRTVNWTLVRWLAVGSVPSAFLGAYVVDQIASKGTETRIKEILGAVLLIAASAMLVKVFVQARRHVSNDAMLDPRVIRPLSTVAIGLVGGFIVGMTSVGSGSLMIVMLMLLYPALSSREMVGTDLVQAIPLVGAAALGHLIFGNFQLGLTTSVLVGAIPGVYAGAHVSARASDRYIKPVLVAVLTISSLKLLNVSNRALLASTGAAGVALLVGYVVSARRRRRVHEHELAIAA
ncbi:MAG TPA: sulfite exporter TauE/SafE family protein [Acidimicrobiia bacterium]|nr:sulfite exporter TauE/SafE family protein [Acidimicrobiia bacterium]